MTTKNEAGALLMDELVNTIRVAREVNHEETSVDAVPAATLRDLAEAYSLIGTHFHHKKDRA